MPASSAAAMYGELRAPIEWRAIYGAITSSDGTQLLPLPGRYPLVLGHLTLVVEAQTRVPPTSVRQTGHQSVNVMLANLTRHSTASQEAADNQVYILVGQSNAMVTHTPNGTIGPASPSRRQRTAPRYPCSQPRQNRAVGASESMLQMRRRFALWRGTAACRTTTSPAMTISKSRTTRTRTTTPMCSKSQKRS